MSGGHLGADAGTSLGDHRVAEAHHIDALLQHPGGEFPGGPGVVEHHGHDGVAALQHVKAQGAQLLPEVGGVLMDPVPQLGGGGEQLDGPDAGGADGGGQGVGEQVGAAALAQQLHGGRR